MRQTSRPRRIWCTALRDVSFLVIIENVSLSGRLMGIGDPRVHHRCESRFMMRCRSVACCSKNAYPLVNGSGQHVLPGGARGRWFATLGSGLLVAMLLVLTSQSAEPDRSIPGNDATTNQNQFRTEASVGQRLALAGTALPVATQPATNGNLGALVGTVLVEGKVEPTLRIYAKGATEINGMPIKDAAICAAEDLFSEEVLVDPKSGGLANVFIYMTKAPTIPAELQDSSVKEVVFDQKNCRFLPHALFARTDQTILVKSDDGCVHNLRTSPTRNMPLNFIVAPKDRKGTPVQMNVPERVPTRIKCDLHPHMTAYWLVLDHPYAAISDAQGKFRIDKLPPGTYDFRLWHEANSGFYIEQKPKTPNWNVKIEAGNATELPPIKVPAALLKKGAS